jgi:chromosome segregation ATPase
MVVSADETVIEDVSVTYQALTDARLAKMDGTLHIQGWQIQEGNMRIQNLKGMLNDHKSEIRKQNRQLQAQNEHIQNIENTMKNYKNEIIKLEDKLSGLELREEKSERRISDLLNVITNIKLDKQKSLIQDLNVDISNTSEESNGENNNMSPDHEKKSKGMCNNMYVIE